MVSDLHLPIFVAIPAGSFPMGTPERELSALAKAHGGTRESYREESPQHPVALPAYCIARTPVTNGLYAAYVAQAGARPPPGWRGPQPPPNRLDHPVTDVSWEEARAFCAWLTSTIEVSRLKIEHATVHGGEINAQSSVFNLQSSIIRLPTEAEWERAARDVDGRRFPWGDAWDVALANTREAGLGRTTPVGSYPEGASPAGCLDMAGNVWEWTSTLDAPYPYRPHDGREDPDAAGRRILRGGCYANPHGYARCACRFRLPPTMRNEFLGFRLALS
ncbi:MAG TPA: formylglycine-generating enzyme family protein [Roseiflexaceae bacterium]|nr:formylglycine-generating enzyme family protein [Roseiflexaceae bacterium]